MEKPNCIFCEIKDLKDEEFIAENDFAFAKWDRNPVSPGHSLVIPKQHIESYFELFDIELIALYSLAHTVKGITDSRFKPDAYNIGVNDGEEAGRTVHHLHMHLIPRFRGDVENPRGGIRHVIPGKGDY